MLPVWGSTSANTGRAPACTIALAVAQNVIGVVIDLVARPDPAASSDRCRAAVHELSATAWPRADVAREFVLEAGDPGARADPARPQRGHHLGDLLLLDGRATEDQEVIAHARSRPRSQASLSIPYQTTSLPFQRVRPCQVSPSRFITSSRASVGDVGDAHQSLHAQRIEGVIERGPRTLDRVAASPGAPGQQPADLHLGGVGGPVGVVVEADLADQLAAGLLLARPTPRSRDVRQCSSRRRTLRRASTSDRRRSSPAADRFAAHRRPDPMYRITSGSATMRR